jgi:hypothetical protein
MKKLNEKQTKINHQFAKWMIENEDDKETKTAVISAQSAFINHINTGEKVNLKVTPTGL